MSWLLTLLERRCVTEVLVTSAGDTWLYPKRCVRVLVAVSLQGDLNVLVEDVVKSIML